MNIIISRKDTDNHDNISKNDIELFEKDGIKILNNYALGVVIAKTKTDLKKLNEKHPAYNFQKEKHHRSVM